MYPAVEQLFLADLKPCRLWIPQESVVQNRYEQSRDSDQPSDFPYWTRVWSAARVMAEQIYQHPQWVEHQAVLELGAGLGLPSFVANRYAQSVIVSDYLPEAVDWLERNIEHQAGPITGRLIDWRIETDLPYFEVLIMSDLFYDPSQHARLHSILEEAWQAGKRILLSTPDRAGSRAFVQNIRIPCTVSETVDCLDHGYEAKVLFQVYHQAIP